MPLACDCPTRGAASAASCSTAYGKAVADHTAATNSLRAYLNGNTMRPARRNLALESTRQ